MRARILFITDMHKKAQNPTNMPGYTKALDAVQADLLHFIKEHSVTHLISTGDLYDRGYRSVNRLSNDRNFDQALSDAVNGNFYICLGNHFFLERDSNPEMYLIQPSSIHKPSHSIFAESPVIRAVDALRIGPVQISFFHFRKHDKNYVRERDEDVTYHIGVYHDEEVVPTAQRSAARFGGTTSTQYMDNIFKNIDLAVVGHIHIPLGTFRVQAGGRSFPMIVPGALAITSSDVNAFHTDVKLPCVDIADDGAVSCKLYTFDLHANLLGITQERQVTKKVRMDMPEKGVFDIPRTLSLSEYLRARGFGDNEVELVEASSEAEVTVKQGLQLLGILGNGGR